MFGLVGIWARPVVGSCCVMWVHLGFVHVRDRCDFVCWLNRMMFGLADV